MVRAGVTDADTHITLKEVQLRLSVPQHVLIHLCEKGVIEPHFAETTGQSKRREFSERNVFEFAVALALRSLEVSVPTTALLVRLLRTFTKAAQHAPVPLPQRSKFAVRKSYAPIPRSRGPRRCSH